MFHLCCELCLCFYELNMFSIQKVRQQMGDRGTQAGWKPLPTLRKRSLAQHLVLGSGRVDHPPVDHTPKQFKQL